LGGSIQRRSAVLHNRIFTTRPHITLHSALHLPLYCAGLTRPNLTVIMTDWKETFPYEPPPNNRPKNRVLRSGCRSHRRTAHVGRTQRDLCFAPARLWRREKYALVPKSSKKAAYARAPGAARRTKPVIHSQIRVRAHPGFWAVRSAKRGRPHHPRRLAGHHIWGDFSHLCPTAVGG